MYQFAQQLRGLCRFHAGNSVAGLCRRQVVADWADAADALRNLRHLEVRAPFAEFLQSAELVHMEEGLIDCALIIQMDCDTPMPLNARYRFNGYLASTHSFLL
jgi:hypothetical protein